MKKFLIGLTFFISTLSQSAYADQLELTSGDVSNGVLYPNNGLISQNNIFRLTQQTDGNLVLYKSGVAIWATFQNGTHTVIQADGNFVQYRGSTPVWASDTVQPPSTSYNHYTIGVQNDGAVYVRGPMVASPGLWKIIIPAGVTLGGNPNPPCQMRPFPVCVFPGTPSQYNSSVSACSQSDAATYASQHGWNFGACH
ncbi:hypothetical protein [Duganella violaceipulchra]|uniref:Bulb-type lectin domain-containing protein n=1 Tax=Duganella violaceipulchra TaxID=2849652 RepID=A0AA41HBB8_9BURK|nr:hypothetical protein [Duganella violaceicalia]MBV6320633.1 hypothetical protein [Duganella violaceicalia]MCP2008656.1 hypothetical protein [Duganella violaceicalia]